MRKHDFITRLFGKDTVAVGLVAGLGSELGYIAVLAAVLLIVGEPVGAHMRWFGGMFIPLILVLRHYAKGREHLRVVKTLIVVFFGTFIVFITYMLKANIIVLQ